MTHVAPESGAVWEPRTQPQRLGGSVEVDSITAAKTTPRHVTVELHTK